MKGYISNSTNRETGKLSAEAADSGPADARASADVASLPG